MDTCIHQEIYLKKGSSISDVVIYGLHLISTPSTLGTKGIEDQPGDIEHMLVTI